MIRIADGDPINRVNLLYTIDVDRIHRIDRTHDVGSIDPDPVWALISTIFGINHANPAVSSALRGRPALRKPYLERVR